MANYTARDERHAKLAALMGKRAAEQPQRKKWRAPIGPPPTLRQELNGGDKWMWFWCPVCLHHGPLALAPLAMVFGMEIATVDAAKYVTCSACGHRGATLQRPHLSGTAGNLEAERFPIEIASAAYDLWRARNRRPPRPTPLRDEGQIT